MASCGGLSPRRHRDGSQPANQGYLMTVSAARDLTQFSHSVAYSESIMCFGENAKFINNILFLFFPPFLAVCVYKTIIMRL